MTKYVGGEHVLVGQYQAVKRRRYKRTKAFYSWCILYNVIIV